MTTKKQLTDKIAELQAQVDAMPDEPSGYWKPKYGEAYWLIDDEGCVLWNTWKDNAADFYRLSQGNVFRTEEEAEHHKKKLDIIGKIRLAAMEDIEKNGELDWGENTEKYYLFYDYLANKWKISQGWFCCQPTTIYFKTKAAAEKCLADLGSELDILIGEE